MTRRTRGWDMTRVLPVVIDCWSPRLFGPALERGDLPTLRELANRGWLSLDSTSIFPSITPALTAIRRCRARTGTRR